MLYSKIQPQSFLGSGAKIFQAFFFFFVCVCVLLCTLYQVCILRAAEGFEKCSQNKGRVGYLPLESNISN